MPGLVTHCVFGARVLRELPEGQIRSAAARYQRVFYLGCQGPDLFGYNFLRLAFSNHRNLSAYLHNHRIKRLFEQGFAQLPEGEEKELCLAYLAGAYCHYVCDSVCHTFVYARTDFDPQHPTARYYGRHAALENAIDAWYMRREYDRSFSELAQELIFRLPPEERDPLAAYLARVLDGTLGDLFLRSPFHPLFVRRALRMAAIESRLLHDPGASRRTRVEKLENHTLHFPLLSAKFITDQPFGMEDPMNLAHQLWRDPWHKHRLSTASFDQLFCKGVRLAVWLLPQMTKPERFLTMTGNTNYHDEQVLADGFRRLEKAVAAGEALPPQE